MEVVADARHQLVHVRRQVFAVHALVVGAGDDVPEMIDDAVADEHLAVLVEVETPGIGGSMGERLEFFSRGVVRRALTQPLACIAHNSGVDSASVVARVMAAADGVGYNARTGELVNMIAAGVMDPVKVTYTALQNAVSVAALILTTETLIAVIPDDEDPTAGRARGGGAEKYGMR